MTGVSILDTFCYPDKAVSYVAEHSYAGMNKWIEALGAAPSLVDSLLVTAYNCKKCGCCSLMQSNFLPLQGARDAHCRQLSVEV